MRADDVRTASVDPCRVARGGGNGRRDPDVLICSGVLFAASWTVPTSRDEDPPPVDVLGSLIAVVSITCLVYGLIQRRSTVIGRKTTPSAPSSRACRDPIPPAAT
jgi:hypothetical protein